MKASFKSFLGVSPKKKIPTTPKSQFPAPAVQQTIEKPEHESFICGSIYDFNANQVNQGFYRDHIVKVSTTVEEDINLQGTNQRQPTYDLIDHGSSNWDTYYHLATQSNERSGAISYSNQSICAPELRYSYNSQINAPESVYKDTCVKLPPELAHQEQQPYNPQTENTIYEYNDSDTNYREQNYDEMQVVSNEAESPLSGIRVTRVSSLAESVSNQKGDKDVEESTGQPAHSNVLDVYPGYRNSMSVSEPKTSVNSKELAKGSRSQGTVEIGSLFQQQSEPILELTPDERVLIKQEFYLPVSEGKDPNAPICIESDDSSIEFLVSKNAKSYQHPSFVREKRKCVLNCASDGEDNDLEVIEIRPQSSSKFKKTIQFWLLAFLGSDLYYQPMRRFNDYFK